MCSLLHQQIQKVYQNQSRHWSRSLRRCQQLGEDVSESARNDNSRLGGTGESEDRTCTRVREGCFLDQIAIDIQTRSCGSFFCNRCTLFCCSMELVKCSALWIIEDLYFGCAGESKESTSCNMWSRSSTLLKIASEENSACFSSATAVTSTPDANPKRDPNATMELVSLYSIALEGEESSLVDWIEDCFCCTTESMESSVSISGAGVKDSSSSPRTSTGCRPVSVTLSWKVVNASSGRNLA